MPAPGNTSFATIIDTGVKRLERAITRLRSGLREMNSTGQLALGLPKKDAFRDLKPPQQPTGAEAKQLSPEQSAEQKRLYTNATATIARNYRKIEKLVEASTTQPQRDQYAKVTSKRWHDVFFFPFRSASLDAFQRTRTDITETDREEIFKHRWSLSDGVRASLQTAIWDAIKSRRFGRFQRAFALVDQRCVPLNYSKLTPKELNNYPLEGCMVAPERVPNELAQRIDPSIFDGDKVTPEVALLRKNTIGFIQGVKRLFESAHGVPGTNQRIQLIGDPAPNVNGAYADAPPWNSELTGAFIRYRGDISTEDRRYGEDAKIMQPNYLTVQIYDDIDSLLRACLHIGGGYRDETGQLGATVTNCEELNLDINTNWTGAPQQVRDEITGKIKSFTQKESNRLKDSTSGPKREARKFVDAIGAKLPDQPTQGDEGMPRLKNTAPVSAKLIGFANRINERSAQIPGKGSANEADLLSIRSLQTKQNRVFTNLLSDLCRVPTILQSAEATQLFDPKVELTPELHDRYARIILSRLNLVPPRLNGVTVRPMLTFARKLREVMPSLEEAVCARDGESAEIALNTILVITQLQRATAAIAKMKEIIAMNEGDIVKKCKEELMKLYRKLNPPEGFPSHSTGQYDRIFNTMLDKLELMDRRFDYYLQPGMTQLPDLAKLKDFLDNPAFQLEKLVREYRNKGQGE